MRGVIATVGATLAIVALVAASAAPANAQVEYASSVYVASGYGGPQIDKITDTLGLAGHLGSDPRLESGREARKPADASGGFIYRDGRYKPLDGVDGLITAHVAIDNRGQTAGAYFRTLDPRRPWRASCAAGRGATHALMSCPVPRPCRSTSTLAARPSASPATRPRARYVPSCASETATPPPSTSRARSSPARPASTTAARWSERTWTPTESTGVT